MKIIIIYDDKETYAKLCKKIWGSKAHDATYRAYMELTAHNTAEERDMLWGLRRLLTDMSTIQDNLLSEKVDRCHNQ